MKQRFCRMCQRPIGHANRSGHCKPCSSILVAGNVHNKRCHSKLGEDIVPDDFYGMAYRLREKMAESGIHPQCAECPEKRCAQYAAPRSRIICRMSPEFGEWAERLGMRA